MLEIGIFPKEFSNAGLRAFIKSMAIRDNVSFNVRIAPWSRPHSACPCPV